MADNEKQTLLKRMKAKFINAFNTARETYHCEPAFNEAAEGEGDGSGGVGYHGFAKGILPGIRDAILVDGRQNVMLRNMRSNSAQFTKMHLSKG